MGLATSTGVGSGRFLRVLVAIAVAAAVLLGDSPRSGRAAPGLIVGFTDDASLTSEGDGSYSIAIELSTDGTALAAPLEFEVVVNAGLSSAGDSDWDGFTPPAALQFDVDDNDGAIRFVTFQATQDNEHEPDEEVVLDLVAVSGGEADPLSSRHTVTISDDDPEPTLSVNSPTAVAEGSSITFFVTLSNPSASTITVDYDTADGTAVAPGDYTARSGTLSFNPGETSKPVVVDTINDAVFEGSESFTLNLSNPSNATILVGSGTGTINASDSQPTLSVNSPTAVAEGSSITFL